MYHMCNNDSFCHAKLAANNQHYYKQIVMLPYVRAEQHRWYSLDHTKIPL